MKCPTYTLIRNRRTVGATTQTVEATGLSWEAGNALRGKLYAEYDREHPGESSWTKDHFEMRMEKGPGDPQT